MNIDSMNGSFFFFFFRTKIFLVFVGEKGSGKTAYSVYMSKSDKINSFCSISLVENTLYQRFLNMKRQKALELSSFKDVWINLIYLILAEKIRKEYGEKRTDHEETWEEIRIKQKDYANCEQKYKVLVLV